MSFVLVNFTKSAEDKQIAAKGSAEKNLVVKHSDNK
ncbi:hypothetical protein SAMN04488156_12255 [Bacillus sp. 166amftsu]|nr:hypothetical protein SAMN04488156_12255 [Bacillus sp. 166amftsu]